jgi:hypothetical protein
LMLGSTLQDLPSDSPAACRSACRERRASLRTGSHPRTILACTRPILVGHAVELATGQPPPDDDGQVQPTPRLAQHRLRQLRARGADSGRRRAGHGHSGRPRRPRPSSRTAACPRRAPGPHFGRTQRTRQRTDTGRPHRTPDSGHLDAQTPAPDTGHRSRGQASVDTGRSHRTPDTGHWTPDAGRGRGQGDEGAAGIRTSWATTPSDRALGRPTVFLWTALAALDSPCWLGGEAAFQREIGSRRQLLGSLRWGRAAPRRTAVLRRLRVEGRANGEASSVMTSGVRGDGELPRMGLHVVVGLSWVDWCRRC